MPSKPLELDSQIRRSDALLSNQVGEDIVMMDIERGEYYGVEGVAARIWDLAAQPITVASLCNQLALEYRVSGEQCRADVLRYLNELVERNIVQVTSGAAK